MTCHRLIPLLTLLATFGAAASEDYNAIFEQAVDGVDFDFEKSWAFTETRIDDEHVWVGRYDPRRPSGERWELKSVDERAPSDDEKERYRKDKAQEHADDGDNGVNAMVKPDSLRLIEETGDYWLFGFTPGEDEEDFMDSVDATVRIRKSGVELEYIDLRNHRPIKPAIGMKLSRLVTRLTFGPAADGGRIVPISEQVDVKGRAYLVISFDEQELTHRSEFEFAGEP